MGNRSPDYYAAAVARHATNAELAIASATQDVHDELDRQPLDNAVHAIVDRGLTQIRDAARQEGRTQAAEDITALARAHQQDQVDDEFVQGLWAAWHVALGEEMTGP